MIDVNRSPVFQEARAALAYRERFGHLPIGLSTHALRLIEAHDGAIAVTYPKRKDRDQ